jgi:hypothetical protein
LTGLNVQAPWSSLLINGLKSIETRSYHIPTKYVNHPLYLVETPGKLGKFKARVIGTITFSGSFKYPNKTSWINDYAKHLVSQNDPFYSWNDKPKYGWVVCSVNKFDEPLDISGKRGIIFTNNLKLLENANHGNG